MDTLRELLEQSIAQHRQLHTCITAIEKRLPLLDFVSTSQATDDLNSLFKNIQATDQQLLAGLRPLDTGNYTDLIEQRMELGKILVEQYKKITPKLQTRLVGYKAELVKIRHGLQTMGGYSAQPSKAGRIINTSN